MRKAEETGILIHQCKPSEGPSRPLTRLCESCSVLKRDREFSQSKELRYKRSGTGLNFVA